MKQLWDILQTIFFVILAGAILFAIPFIGLLLGIAAFAGIAIVLIYYLIREANKETPLE